MKWEITEDRIAETKKDSDVGVRSPDGTAFEGKKFDFRILDDDGELYYLGKYDRESWNDIDGSPGSLYHALQWAQWNAGATDLQIRTRDANAFGDNREGSKGWVSVFG